MKNIIIALLLTLFIGLNAQAQSRFVEAERPYVKGSEKVSIFNNGTEDIVILNNAISDPKGIRITSAGNLTVDGSLTSTSGTITTGTIESAAGLICKVDSDPQRLFTFDASSDTALTLKFGDGGTTAAQTLFLGAATADADDDSELYIGGGGAGANTRGAFLHLEGNEEAGAGDAELSSGDASGGSVFIYAPHSAGTINFSTATNTRWTVQEDGDLQGNASAGGDINITRTGKTLAIDSGTAASACRGTGTFNGTTAVTINTTCAATGATVLVQPSSDPTGATAAYCWFTNIVNGTSFQVDCDQANDGTFHWIIIKEG